MLNLRDSLVAPKDDEKGYLYSCVKKAKSLESIVIFGLGRGGRNVFQLLTEHEIINIEAFCDNNQVKQEQRYEDIPIYSPQISVNNFPEATFIISCVDDVSARQQLLDLGVSLNRILVFDLTWYSPQIDNSSFIRQHISEFDHVFQWLDEDLSRDVYVNLLNYKLTRDTNYLKKVYDPNETQYFNSLIQSVRGKTFVDVGAYVGDSLESYINWCGGSFERVICFEANKANYMKIIKKINRNQWKNVEAIPLAITQNKGELLFNSISAGGGYLSDTVGDKVSCDSLDHVLQREKIDFIKMDIEGGEYDALLGAQEIILKYHPVIAFCVYHKKDDFYKLPQTVKNMYSGYRFYFRHYTLTEGETVCYAIAD
ncbi:MAG: FkbM family methyltransferase [Sporolactobacillus sp.]